MDPDNNHDDGCSTGVKEEPQDDDLYDDDDDDESSAKFLVVSHRLPSDDGPLVGALAISLVLGCLAIGPVLPIWIVYWYFGLGWTRWAVTAAVLVVTSMVIAQPSPRWCRFYLKAAGWFDKGVYLHIERRALEQFGRHASMWCLHPHGTANGFGFTLNGAIRCRAHDPDRFVPRPVQEVLAMSRQLSCDGVMAPILFRIPLVRSLLIGCGCCTPATKAGMLGLLQRRLDFGILPGGMEEVALYTYQTERVYLSRRAGFIKYGLQHGYLLLPGYTFGECDLYQSLTAGASIRLWMQKYFGLVVPIFWGPLWYAPWLPRRDVALHTVIGSPVLLPHIDQPTPQDVEQWHGIYMAAVRNVFDSHKERFGYGDRELEIV
jgi:Diacylglycerol acyltransferase